MRLYFHFCNTLKLFYSFTAYGINTLKRKIQEIRLSEEVGRLTTEGVCGKKPLVTLDLMSKSPLLYKEVKSNLLRESCHLSDVT